MMRKALALLMLLAASCAPVAATAQEALSAPGEGRFIFDDSAPRGTAAITVHTYVPAACVSRSCPLVISMHGLTRNGAAARDNWIAAADANGLIVAAPEFDKDRFPTRLYQQGGVQSGSDRADWLYATIERLFDRLKSTGRIAGETYVLFGHSAGAQFVHRMVLMMPEARWSAALIGNAGYYTLPLPREAAEGRDYPFSLGATSATAESLARAFAKPMLVLLGDQDNDPEHFQLNNSAGAKAQGPHRLARGQFFFAAAQAEARRLGLPFAWRLAIVPGVAHEQRKMASAAATLLFGR